MGDPFGIPNFWQNNGTLRVHTNRFRESSNLRVTRTNNGQFHECVKDSYRYDIQIFYMMKLSVVSLKGA
jgi:hypothetical protein